ncbi:hypothetical protein [Methanolapillus ohkumae]
MSSITHAVGVIGCKIRTIYSNPRKTFVCNYPIQTSLSILDSKVEVLESSVIIQFKQAFPKIRDALHLEFLGYH